MAISIEKKHAEIYAKVADEANKASKRFSNKGYKTKPTVYEKLLNKKDVTIEKKKKELADNLHKLIVKTFSVCIKKIKTKKIIEDLKTNLKLLRLLIDKLGDINYYLETVFLEEIGQIKVKGLKSLDKKNLKELSAKEREHVPKKELEKIEFTVYKLIEKSIFLDKKLLDEYKTKEEKIVEQKKVGLKDLESLLKKESELLCHIEAKLPPPSKVRGLLLEETTFSHWASRVLALLVAFENEYEKEKIIFNEIKKNNKTKRRIDKKIKHLIKEKWDLLKIKEKKALSMEEVGEIEEEHLRRFHHWASTSAL
ncbi:hypothetical protein J4209_02065 [Candidatus Woesearchaeota archaeon]|nr:hypothetical protein [Candidatus Woesearchaeota archaeon]